MDSEVASSHDPKSNSSVKKAMTLTKRLRARSPGTRQVVNAGLMGVSIVFIASMLSLQKLDLPLTVAVIAFASALPLLAYGFLMASYRFTGWRGIVMYIALVRASQALEAIGQALAVVGIAAALSHINPLAAIVFGTAIVLTFPFTWLAMAISLVVIVVPHERRKRRRQRNRMRHTSSTTTSNDMAASQ